jgi:hypothetical protein
MVRGEVRAYLTALPVVASCAPWGRNRLGLFDACPCLLPREGTTTRAGRRWTSLEGGNRGVDRRGGSLRRLWGLKGADRQPCHGRRKQIRVGMISKVASKVSFAML